MIVIYMFVFYHPFQLVPFQKLKHIIPEEGLFLQNGAIVKFYPILQNGLFPVEVTCKISCTVWVFIFVVSANGLFLHNGAIVKGS